METYTVRAFAKLTRTLRVVGRRDDGYHLIEAEMVTVDLADRLTIGPGAGLTVNDEVRWIGPVAGEAAFVVPADSSNLVARALVLAGIEAAVVLDKAIPAGAGLGGGSADAAAILRLAGFADLAAAARLGADVPFCLRGGRALVSGIGEVLTALPFLELGFVILTPGFGISTAAVYAAYDELGAAAEGRNDLAHAAFAVEPRLAHWRDLVGEVSGMTPLLAGSGSSLFVECAPSVAPALADSLRRAVIASGERACVEAVSSIEM